MHWRPSQAFVVRFESLHRRLADKWGTGTSSAAWNALGIPHNGGDWVDFKNEPDTTRRNATKSETVAERIIIALFQETLSNVTHRPAWKSERGERIALGDMLHGECCTSKSATFYPHPSRPADASPRAEDTIVPPVSPSDGLWRIVDPSEFDIPTDPADEADLFVRGFRKASWWTATSVGHVRDRRIEEIRNHFRTRNVVVLLGPIGQGKSVLLRQVAKDHLDKGGAVAEIVSPFGVNLDLVKWIDANPSPLILADGIDFIATLLAAFAYRIGSGNKAKILLAYETRLWPLHKMHFGSARHDYVVPDLDHEERTKLVGIIDQHRQPDTPDPAAIRELIDQAYRHFPEGGLWVALYSASKGRGLEERMRDLIQRLWDHDKPKFWALAGTVFVNAIDTFARRVDPRMGFDDALRSVAIAGLLGHLDLKSDLRTEAQTELSMIGQWLDKELMNDGMAGWSSNPSLKFRAPAVTDVLFRHIFGAHDEERGERRVDRWNFYLPLARAFSKAESPRSASNCLSLMFRLNRDVRFVNHLAGVRKRLGVDRAVALQLIAEIADVALEADDSDQRSVARIRLWRAQILATPETIDIAELQRAVTEAGPSPEIRFLVEMADTLERWGVILRDPETAIERDWANFASRAEAAIDKQRPLPWSPYIELFKIFARYKSHSASDLARLANKSRYFTHPDNDFALTCHHISERWRSKEAREAEPAFATGSGKQANLDSLLGFYRLSFETFASNPSWRAAPADGGTAGHLRSILNNFLRTFEADMIENDPDLLNQINGAVQQKDWFTAFDLHGRLGNLRLSVTSPSF